MNARFYVVGGAVRDALLGLPATDRDWVVVGATPQQLLELGYKPVGKDFPVFLDPRSGEEVALARTERKVGPGYHGFSFHAAPEVTLEQDLARRDLTINAMARAEDGTLTDPFGGQADLQARVLRHVSPAFAEDPVRVLRLARLAARLADFSVAAETMTLVRRMVAEGEVDALVPERVWQELSRGLMTAQPGRMLDLLQECGALARLLPDLDRAWDEHRRQVLDTSARIDAPLPVRWACLVQGLGEPTLVRALGQKLRVSTECAALAELVTREAAVVHTSAALHAAALMDLLERCDALRRPERFAALLQACACAAGAQASGGPAPYPPQQRLPRLLQAALAVDTAAVASRASAEGKAGPAIGAAVRQARIARIQAEQHGSAAL